MHAAKTAASNQKPDVEKASNETSDWEVLPYASWLTVFTNMVVTQYHLECRYRREGVVGIVLPQQGIPQYEYLKHECLF